ncbi:CinA family protein [Aestuariibacter halophilus]|uniref:CinA family protein n=1 Tax=Fluctibacter halophilus TaxID=226011 RepID=A0ABS8G7T5_9ALTE|nr:CinA family protein [Aestuariibacter halophilus]MCC2616649.1 CinA family protein [Aestuariibacter halophilus]
MRDSILSLAAQLGEQLVARDWHVSTAESCTGGGIAYAITSTAGSSGWFNEGFVTYSNDAKMALLGVPQKTLEEHGAVSRQTVEKMVQGLAQRTGAQANVVVSGIAGPDGGSETKPVGTVWFGFLVDGVVRTEERRFFGDRAQVRDSAIEYSLQKLLQLITD